jgi:hypothetical protein
MKLTTVAATDTGIELQMNEGGDEIITVRSWDALEDGARIVRAVNMFDALVGALTPFRSSEMGGLLVDMIDMREEGGEQAQKRLSHLISVIDVILDLAEKEYDEPLGA